ncbi:MAG TPA: MBL fold metallo-hydrolase [Candidatus Limnocylindrales bacterium]|nr:MBL fold metallo-hydrolase [Candidatus Limnocylindrales bacterium]
MQMLNFCPIASSSNGNLYTLEDGESKILIECGLPIKGIKRALGFGLSEISFCLLSHAHADHSKAAKDIMKAGLDIYTSQGTIDALGLVGHRAHAIQAGVQFTSGNWIVMPVEAQHDTPEPLAFLIYSKHAREKMLFATDTFYLKNTFTGLNIIAVECNYAADILRANVDAGSVPTAMKKRLIKSHFSLENVKKFLLANDLSKLQEIWLIHCSSANSDPERFKIEVQQITGKPTYVAEE